MALTKVRSSTFAGIAALLTALLAVTTLIGCASNNNDTAATSASSASATTAAASKTAEPVTVNVMSLKGPTAMGMVKLMSAVDEGGVASNDFRFSIVASVDEVPAAIAKGEVDLAAVPANLASVLYNNTDGQVQVLAINTLGVLYLVENGESLTSLSQIKGKTIYAAGKGATPEYALRYVLESNGINPDSDVTIDWLPEHSACITSLETNPEGIALLPQPFVATAQAKNASLRVAFDLTAEWEKIGGGSSLITGVLVARKAFAEANPGAIADFLARYEESITFVNENPEKASELIGSYDIVPAAVALKALPQCNVVFISGNAMMEKLSGYLQSLFDQNPKSVGGALPKDDFYYQAQGA